MTSLEEALLGSPYEAVSYRRVWGILSRNEIQSWESLLSKNCTDLNFRGMGAGARKSLASLLKTQNKRLRCGCPHMCGIPRHHKNRGLGN